jgi:hypothetical protein
VSVAIDSEGEGEFTLFAVPEVVRGTSVGFSVEGSAALGSSVAFAAGLRCAAVRVLVTGEVEADTATVATTIHSTMAMGAQERNIKTSEKNAI